MNRSNTKSAQAASEKKLRAAVFETDLGWSAAVWQGDKLWKLRFGYADARAALAAAEFAPDTNGPLVENRAFAKRLRAYAAGQAADDFRDLAIVEDDLTEFQRRVVRCCRKIPYGGTASYGDLASRAGSPGAARAVGSVMAHNRLPLIVPCHRVIAAGGSLGGYSASDGLPMKQRLLALESAGLESARR